MRIRSLAIISIVFGLVLSGCKHDDVSAAWYEVLKKCVSADQLGSKLVYFGPSNNIGPGALWRKADDGGLFVRYVLRDAIPDEEQRGALIIPGEEANCKGTAKSSWSLKPSLLVETKAAPITGELALDLNRARSVTVAVHNWSLDQIKEGPFETWLRRNPENAYVLDATRDSRLVLERAVRVLGFSTTLEFSRNDALELKAKYSGPALGTGQLGIGLGAKWTGDTTLELTSTKNIYIAGELVSLKGGRFGILSGGKSGGTLFEKADLGPVRVKGNDGLQ